MNQELKKFIKNGLLFLLPLILFFGFSFLVLLKSGELDSLNQIIQYHQNNKSSLVGLAYSDPVRYFKLQSVISRQPKIIALGSSHTAFFSSAFFKSPDSFYNANLGGAHLQDLNVFLSHLPLSNQPKIILLGLDPGFFEPVCDLPDRKDLEQEYSQRFNSSNPLRAWQYGYTKIYKDYFSGKFSLKDLLKIFQSRDLGLNAIINKTGYRWDGTSVNYLEIAFRSKESSQEFQKRTTTDFFKFQRKQRCEESFPKEVEEIKKFLAESKTRNIQVIAFITPYTTGVYKELQKQKDKYNYIFNLEPALRPIFKQYGFGLYNFSNIKAVGISDQEMLDQDHSSEKASLKMLLLMRRYEPALWPYTDFSYLTKMSFNLILF